MKVRISATKPEVPGRPSDERPPMVNAVAMPGITRPKPPIRKISRECAFSYTRPTRAKKRPVITPWANIWKTEPLRPASVSVAAPSITSPMCETDEYATTYFKSTWAIAERAPYTTLMQARPHLAARAPDADEQVHRQHRQLVEQEEHEEVERDEDTVHAGDEGEQQRVELLAPHRHRPRREDAGEDDDRGQQHQQQADAVHAELVVDPERRHQRDLPVELEAGAAGERRLAVVRPVEPEGERGRDPGADGGDEPHRERTAARREHDQQRADERRPRDDRQDREAHG